MKRKQEREEALKRQKAEEVAAAAAERERKMKEKQERKEEEERQRQLEEERLKEEEAKRSNTKITQKPPVKPSLSEPPKKVKREVPAWLNPSAAKDKSGGSGVNRYKKKKGKRFKSSRKKVSALISGFEQIENEEEVFNEEDAAENDPAALLLRMLSTSIITETDPRKCMLIGNRWKI